MYLFPGKDVGRHFHDYTYTVCHSERMLPVMICHRTITLTHRQGEVSKSVHIKPRKKKISM